MCILQDRYDSQSPPHSSKRLTSRSGSHRSSRDEDDDYSPAPSSRMRPASASRSRPMSASKGGRRNRDAYDDYDDYDEYDSRDNGDRESARGGRRGDTARSRGREDR